MNRSLAQSRRSRPVLPSEYLHLDPRRGRPSPDRKTWVIRPDDLLVLSFELVNLKVEASEDQETAQVVKQRPGQAYLVVTFPPQNLAEQAYFTTVEGYPVSTPEGAPEDLDEELDAEARASGIDVDPPDAPPIHAILAGWSRLVFKVPDAKLPFPWTLQGLLEVMEDLELSIPPNALPPKAYYPQLDKSLWTMLDQVGIMREDLLGELHVMSSEGQGGRATMKKITSAKTPVGDKIIATARARRRLRAQGGRFGLGALNGSADWGFYEAFLGDWIWAGLPEIMLRCEPAPPTGTQTAIELPYRLILSPNRYGAWLHAKTPATSHETGYTELWHTRLGTRSEVGKPFEGEDWRRTLRAVWALGYHDLTTPPFGGMVDIPGPSNLPFRMSLNDLDRHNIVHLSSNFKLQSNLNPSSFYEPPPINVKLLALSSLGAWLDSRAVWDDLPNGLSVEEWRHLATLGRDHYVRVVYAGFLFPWGHRASLIKVTERLFHEDTPGNQAYLRQRMFLVVREPVKTYRNSGLINQNPDGDLLGASFDRMMPFERVQITTLVSPLLDPPEDDAVEGSGALCFWPNVGRQPFKFRLIATDTVGNPVELAMPLIFVSKEKTDELFNASIMPGQVAEAYEKNTWPNSDKLLASVPAGGQRMAFAESAAPDDTTFAAQWLTFGVETPSESIYNTLVNSNKHGFFPVLRDCQIDVPALQSIARTSDPASMKLSPQYLIHGFGEGNEDNIGQVFLEKLSPTGALEVIFSKQGDRSGGLVTPDLTLEGLSRRLGPISGDIATVAAGSFDPVGWFGALDGAKLFGVFSLGDILEAVGLDELAKLPRFVGRALNQVEQLITDLERLYRLVEETPGNAADNLQSQLNELLNSTTGSIPSLLGGGSPAAVVYQLAALEPAFDAFLSSMTGSDQLAGPKALAEEAIASVKAEIDKILNAADLLQSFADGELLPEALNARFEWRPLLKDWPESMPIFKPTPGSNGERRNLLISVQAAGEDFTVTCSLDKFQIDIVVLVLTFDRVQLRMRGGKKPEIDVKFEDFVFAGPLSFVQTLREIIPFNGFSDPPDVQVTAEGITAGFSMGLPNLAIGVFSLENLALAAGFSVPFIGPPMSVWFHFCERENPARLTVSLFGGGFYFGITVNANGLQILEGAIEFGAAISVNFGVASGSVSAMAGLYFKIEGADFTLAGYFRLRGEVEALGLISVSIELYLELRYESGSGKCVGTATISIEIDITLFSVTIEITCTKKFAGANGDPTFAELMDVAPDATSADWITYCSAFA